MNVLTWRRDGVRWMRERLRAREWSQADLARSLDVPNGTVSRWMTGDRPPAAEFCARIAAAFGADVDELLTLAGHRPRLEDGTDPVVRDVTATMRLLTPANRQTVRDFATFTLQRQRREEGAERVG